MIGNFRAMAEEEMNKAFRYYNYVREFYGYLCDSLDLVFEDDCDEFDPSYAPAEKEFAPAEGNDDSLTPKAKLFNKMSRAICAYETMQSIIVILDMDGVEEAAQKRGMMQDTHKFALTSIAEWFPTTSLWREFDMYSNNQLNKYANDAQSAVALMDSLLLEDSVHKIFEKQKDCLEKFLPKKIDALKKLRSKMMSSFKESADWAKYLRMGELVILAAHPGEGLRTFALNVAENVALDDCKAVVYFDLDNRDMQSFVQLLCQHASVEYWKMTEEHLDEAEKKMLLMSSRDILHSRLHIENAGCLNLTELAQKARLYKQLNGLNLLVIDYLQLLKVQPAANRAESLKRATWALKSLAMELNISIMLLYSLGRRMPDDQERPKLSDFREVPGITQEADEVWLIDDFTARTHHHEDRGKAELTIVKVADNSTKSIPLRFTRKRGFALADAYIKK